MHDLDVFAEEKRDAGKMHDGYRDLGSLLALHCVQAHFDRSLGFEAYMATSLQSTNDESMRLLLVEIQALTMPNG